MAEDHIDSDAFAAATQELQNLVGLMKTLNDDVLQFREAKDSASRRALVRAVFAYIEGSSFGFRSAALSLARIRNISLTLAESLMCREVTYALNEKGQVEEKQILSPSLANLRFALAIFSKVAGAPYEFPAGDSKFESLQVAQRIRNRLMHPRRMKELEVSPEEQALVLKTLDWIGEQQTKVAAAFAFRLYSFRPSTPGSTCSQRHRAVDTQHQMWQESSPANLLIRSRLLLKKRPSGVLPS